jgi:hypothetical protein
MHSLASAVTAAALLAMNVSTAAGQAPAAQEPRPSEPSPLIVSLFDHQPPPTKPPKLALESWFSGFKMNCIGCSTAATTVRPESTNRNAPWVLQGKWQRETRLGVASVGFVGIRNSALPPSSVIPLAGDPGFTSLNSSHTSFFMPSTQWSVTAGLEKTLVKFSNGASVGAVADFIVPVHTTSAVAADRRLSGMKSAALRWGFVVRW